MDDTHLLLSDWLSTTLARLYSLLGAIGMHYAHLRLGLGLDLGLGLALGLGLVLGLGVGLALVFSET